MRSRGIAGVLSARPWAALPGAPGSGVQPLTGNATGFLARSHSRLSWLSAGVG